VDQIDGLLLWDTAREAVVLFGTELDHDADLEANLPVVAETPAALLLALSRVG